MGVCEKNGRALLGELVDPESIDCGTTGDRIVELGPRRRR